MIFKTLNKRKSKLNIFSATLALALSLALTGCGTDLSDIRLVFTTGFSKNEVFTIEDRSCNLSEALVYLVNTQEGYEQSFGNDIWQKETDEGTVEDRLKESVLAKVAQIKAMNLLAEKNGIVLDDSEMSLALQAADEYYGGLTDADIAAMGNVTLEEVASIYEERALADKLYDYIIRDINPEISDDEARTITVEQILLKTYTLDASGEKTPVSDTEKAAIYRNMRSIVSELNDGKSFEELMTQYNEADEETISFGKGDMEPIYDTTAFNLGTGEVSDIIETSEGYVIIKCITTFNREETEANKEKIVAERKREVFGQQYDAFVATLNKRLNEKLWNSVTLVADEGVSTSNLMDVYQKYFR
ncbi:foldase protein PrsA [Butyrivibrio proteoclasticus]|uniref:Foldase protein PrsA n=1 Tax=Butyrivibrio proteoclasticus TaxID=43305 RepID=A0A1I5X638_9FIRM|nr:peptidylprolyl isomerase [Butyrivibrio proteoclasticus]SFQ27408.1 foldase protein PrsA [Butyrivibrio proteoclasticus]